MGERDLDRHPSRLVREPRGEPVQTDRGAAFGVAGDLDLAPADRARAGKRLHRLVDRLLGGDPCRGVSGGVGPGGEVGALLAVKSRPIACSPLSCSIRAIRSRSTRSIPTPMTLTAGPTRTRRIPPARAAPGRSRPAPDPDMSRPRARSAVSSQSGQRGRRQARTRSISTCQRRCSAVAASSRASHAASSRRAAAVRDRAPCRRDRALAVRLSRGPARRLLQLVQRRDERPASTAQPRRDRAGVAGVSSSARRRRAGVARLAPAASSKRALIVAATRSAEAATAFSQSAEPGHAVERRHRAVRISGGGEGAGRPPPARRRRSPA